MLKMLKDARAEVAETAKPAPGPEATPLQRRGAPPEARPESVSTPQHLQTLVDKLTSLDAQLDAKLERVQRLTDEKLSRLEALDHRVVAAAQQLGQDLKDGSAVSARLDAAVQQSHGLPARITQQLERFDDHLAAYRNAGAQAFTRELDRVKESVLDEIRADLGDLADVRVERALGEFRDRAAAMLKDLADAQSANQDGGRPSGDDRRAA